MELFRLKTKVEKGLASEAEQEEYFGAQRDLAMTRAQKMSVDEQQQMEIAALALKYRSKFESEEEKKQYEQNNMIRKIKNEFSELKHSDLKHSTLHAYNRYMNIQGFSKRPFVPAPENPVKQR